MNQQRVVFNLQKIWSWIKISKYFIGVKCSWTRLIAGTLTNDLIWFDCNHINPTMSRCLIRLIRNFPGLNTSRGGQTLSLPRSLLQSLLLPSLVATRRRSLLEQSSYPPLSTEFYNLFSSKTLLAVLTPFPPSGMSRY